MRPDGGTILLVEDDENDVELFMRAYSQARITNPVQRSPNGDEAVAYLLGEGKKRVPVVVLTSSKDNTDINHAYDLGANSYLVKPVAYDSLFDLIRSLNLY